MTILGRIVVDKKDKLVLSFLLERKNILKGTEE
jgi:hypothetical protein